MLCVCTHINMVALYFTIILRFLNKNKYFIFFLHFLQLKGKKNDKCMKVQNNINTFYHAKMIMPYTYLFIFFFILDMSPVSVL